MLIEEKLERVNASCRTSSVTVDSADGCVGPNVLHLLALPPKELTIAEFLKLLLSPGANLIGTYL